MPMVHTGTVSPPNDYIGAKTEREEEEEESREDRTNQSYRFQYQKLTKFYMYHTQVSDTYHTCLCL